LDSTIIKLHADGAGRAEKEASRADSLRLERAYKGGRPQPLGRARLRAGRAAALDLGQALGLRPRPLPPAQ